MEDRGFKELNILPCSYQSQADRYPTKGRAKAPPLALYRNNLCQIALSQCRNLLFVASFDQIYIYKPQFPSQTVSGDPELILNVSKSHRGLRGHIDPSKPHAVNQLVIGDLGNEEIILIVCDDGDVAIYTTRSICKAIKQDAAQDRDRPKSPIEIETLFLKNIGISAWGVAIHKAARMIAVSSNLHQISVFAFALKRDSSPDSASSEHSKFLENDYFGTYDNFWERVDTSTYSSLHRNSRNVELVLKGHEANIPNIAFCNSKADPIGQYLVSTDITGSMFVWDIWQRKVIADVSPTWSKKAFCGWGVACLDPQTYRLANSNKEVFGCDDIKCYGIGEENADPFRFTFDNTANSQAVANSSQMHPHFSKYNIASAVSPAQSTLDESESWEEGANPDSEEISENGDDIEIYNIENEDESEHANENEEIQNETNKHTLSSQVQTETSLQESNAFNHFLLFKDTKTDQHQESMSLPFDIFTTTEFDIHFIFDVSIQEDNKYPEFSQSVLCKEALHQEIPPILRYIFHFERLNMVIQIPELSVIIIANQIGRVALVTTTKRTGARNQHGFRIDWILPFRSQEEQNLRSDLPLAGIAASPVQCRDMMPDVSSNVEDDSAEIFCADAYHQYPTSAEVRRYRLFLIYCDNSILTYEFWRPSIESRHGAFCEHKDLVV